jgi:alkylhydroperoxidase family enzyme
MRYLISIPFLLLLSGLVRAGEPAQPPPVPVTRPDMKQALECSKKAKPRLPLPPLTDEEKTQLGDRPVVNNGRMRQLYLPAELRGGDFVREPDPAMTLDPTFKTMLFWIVSRVNNCHYWLGHQEIKLAVAGLGDDRIAALDLDWSEFTPAERAAFELARRLTYEPHTVNGAVIDRLRKHYSDLQILELVFTVANNNATNRWTSALGIPAEEDAAALLHGLGKRAEYRTFLTPTADKYRDRPSQVAPLELVKSGEGSGPPAPARRPALETREQVEAALAACRTRSPRLPLVEEDKARELLPADWPKGPVPEWVRLLANFPKAGKARVLGLRAAEEQGTLSARLKAQVAWIAARQDRAWYAVACAERRLRALGLSEDEVYALDGAWDGYTAAERAAFDLARKLTAAPDLVGDEDIAGLRQHYPDKGVAELILHVCNAAFFDRVTEAAALRLEDK